MLRKPLSQADIKSSKAEKVMEVCHRLARHNETYNTLEQELKLWIEVLERLQKKPEDIPSPEEIGSLSTMQMEDLWLKVGMVKETLVEEEFKKVLDQIKAEKATV
ncbi:hypothetical protein FO519_007119 [Halicephalobus sp. NKZ332]|nr:hypothetical protein FO519_007119 [Halicephalobus sp. NKZ332]